MAFFSKKKQQQYEEQIQALKTQITDLTTELRDVEDKYGQKVQLEKEISGNKLIIEKLTHQIKQGKNVVCALQEIVDIKQAEYQKLSYETSAGKVLIDGGLNQSVALLGLNGQNIEIDEELIKQEYGLYRTSLDISNIDGFKQKLQAIRHNQLNLIKTMEAISYEEKYSVNGDRIAGKKMVANNMKLALNFFNCEFDLLCKSLTADNFASVRKQLVNVFEKINSLSSVNQIQIKQCYLDSKVEELHLIHEYMTQKAKRIQNIQRTM